MRFTRALVGLLLLCMLLTLWPVSALAGDGTYTVNPGDTLAKIAAGHGASVAALMQANGIQNPDLISTGQRLIIPGPNAAPASSAPVAAVNPAVATASVAAPASASPAHVAALVEAPASSPPSTATSIEPAAAAAEPSPAGGVYIVKPGDTLAKIAAATGTSVAALMQANGIKNSNLVYTGQRLVIPGKGGTQAKPAPAAGPVSAPAVAAPAGGTGLVASISKQRCYLFQGGSITDTWPCSTGRSGWGTAVGNFKVQSKIPRAYGSRWGFWMPYWLGIYWAGGTENGIHGLPIDAKTGYRDWGNKIGTPISFGCIVLQDAAAKKLYDMAYIGMPVAIRR
ncbi:MAG: LysM peptidoglycan-binding domain-containing protein [Anaerolineae bacterium]|nr:LysM peptidoglycan-binding domain-containing protein [Anaerolineae bacterium]